MASFNCTSCGNPVRKVGVLVVIDKRCDSCKEYEEKWGKDK